MAKRTRRTGTTEYDLPNENPGGAFPTHPDVAARPPVPDAREGYFPYRGEEQHGVPHTTEQPDQRQDTHQELVPERQRGADLDHDPLAVKIVDDTRPRTRRALKVWRVYVAQNQWSQIIPLNPRRVYVILANDQAPPVANAGVQLSDTPGGTIDDMAGMLPGARTIQLQEFHTALYGKAALADGVYLTVYEVSDLDI